MKIFSAQIKTLHNSSIVAISMPAFKILFPAHKLLRSSCFSVFSIGRGRRIVWGVEISV